MSKLRQTGRKYADVSDHCSRSHSLSHLLGNCLYLTVWKLNDQEELTEKHNAPDNRALFPEGVTIWPSLRRASQSVLAFCCR